LWNYTLDGHQSFTKIFVNVRFCPDHLTFKNFGFYLHSHDLKVNGQPLLVASGEYQESSVHPGRTVEGTDHES